MKFKSKFLKSRKRKIALVSIFFLLLAVGIAGTYLYDKEVSKSNLIQAATFDIKVNGTDKPGTILDIKGIKAGESYTTTVPVTLNGSGKGELELEFINLKNSDSVTSEPEYYDSETTYTRNLSDFLYVSVNGRSRSTLKDGLTKEVGIIEAGETTNVVIQVDAKTTLENDLQGDLCKFDIVFSCEQE